MTAATITATPPVPELAIELGLETPRAVRLADVDDVATRRQLAAQAIGQRRADLALLRALLLEVYGKAPELAKLEAADEVLTELNVLAVA